MKNQYFGDISFYREIGILRSMLNGRNVKLLISWMMTANDDTSDGSNTNYLKKPVRWAQYDPQLYKFLQGSVNKKQVKGLSYFESSSILDNTSFYSKYIEDSKTNREAYFIKLSELLHLQEPDLIYFEPDNGIEVSSIKKGNKGSNKYIYKDEILEIYKDKYSLLVFQYFPRVKHVRYTKKRATELLQLTESKVVYSIATSRFVLFLLPQTTLMQEIGNFWIRLGKVWKDQVEIIRHSPDKLFDLTEEYKNSLF